jgi:hypothetical protein
MIKDFYMKSGDDEADTSVELLNTTVLKVAKILKEHYPDHLEFGNGSFTLTNGSSQIMIIVRPFANHETCVECISHVVSGAKINEDLMRFLLRKNAELHFGAFGLIFDDTVTFSHSITGTNLDENELITTLNSVAVISDFYDDKIVELAGGKRAIDLHEDFI